MHQKMKLLLIDADPNQVREFKTCILFHNQFELSGVTGSETEALKYLEDDNIDVVVMDLELSEGNGVQLAGKIRSLPIVQPFVVITTNNTSEAIHQYLRQDLKVDFIFQKNYTSYTPNQVLYVVEKTFKYHNQKMQLVYDEKQILRNNISYELQNIGFQKQYIGTEYITSALLLLSDNHDEYCQISKSIYPALATQYHTNPSNIEKSIRMAIERVWNNASLIQLQKYYPFEVKNKNGRPSNGEFINNMKEKLFGKKVCDPWHEVV